MLVSVEEDCIADFKNKDSLIRPTRNNDSSSETESAAPDYPLLMQFSSDSSADQPTPCPTDSPVAFDHIPNEQSTQNINLNREADRLYPILHCLEDANASRVGVPSEYVKHQTSDLENQKANSDVSVLNTTTKLQKSVHFKNPAKERKPDTACDGGSTNLSKSVFSKQLSVGSDNTNKPNYKLRHYALLSSKTSSHASDVEETILKCIRLKCPDHLEYSKLVNKQSLVDTICKLFESRGINEETLVIVLTGEGLPEGLKFQDDTAYKLDAILGCISDQHMTSLKAGFLPNHVTVMFLCSYGHCYNTAKKYTNSMNVMACTDTSNPELKLGSVIFLLSTETVPQNNNSKKRPQRSQSIRMRMSSMN